MTQKLDVERVWWRNVQRGEFYNIERYHRIGGGGGSLYIEIPGSMVAATLDFLDVTSGNLNELPVTINAGTIGKPGIFSPIEFQKIRRPDANRESESPATKLPATPGMDSRSRISESTGRRKQQKRG